MMHRWLPKTLVLLLPLLGSKRLLKSSGDQGQGHRHNHNHRHHCNCKHHLLINVHISSFIPSYTHLIASAAVKF